MQRWFRGCAEELVQRLCKGGVNVVQDFCAKVWRGGRDVLQRCCISGEVVLVERSWWRGGGEMQRCRDAEVQMWSGGGPEEVLRCRGAKVVVGGAKLKSSRSSRGTCAVVVQMWRRCCGSRM